MASTGNAADFGDTIGTDRAGGGCSNAVRMIIVGGKPHPSAAVNTMEFVEMASLGNALDFGDLETNSAGMIGGSSSGTRAVFSGGYDESATHQSKMQFVQIMTTGNATDFGEMTAAKEQVAATSNGHGGL